MIIFFTQPLLNYINRNDKGGFREREKKKTKFRNSHNHYRHHLGQRRILVHRRRHKELNVWEGIDRFSNLFTFLSWGNACTFYSCLAKLKPPSKSVQQNIQFSKNNSTHCTKTALPFCAIVISSFLFEQEERARKIPSDFCLLTNKKINLWRLSSRINKSKKSLNQAVSPKTEEKKMLQFDKKYIGLEHTYRL